MTNEQIRKLIQKTNFYHGWEIVPGIHSGGKSITDPKRTLDRYGVPQDLHGLTALDIGAWDGPYSFELERRGAKVTSYDIQDPNATAYNTVHKILNSSNSYVQGSVYDIDSNELGYFDIVLYLGVFYHLKHPMVAWNRIREILKPNGILFFEGAVLDYAYNVDDLLKEYKAQLMAVRDLPITYFSTENYANHWSNWYIPTRKCVESWLIASGFKRINMDFIETHSRIYGSARINPNANFIEHGMSNANNEAQGAQNPNYIPSTE